MKNLTKDATEKLTNDSRIKNYSLETDAFKSRVFDKELFKQECKNGMSVEEFRAAALKHVNSLPWKMNQ